MGDSNGEWGQLASQDDELAAAWDSYGSLPDPGERLALDEFIERKNLSHAALLRVGARLSSDQVLAFAFPDGIKYRDMITGRRWASLGAEFKHMKIVPAGPEPTDIVIVAEGETDAAWLSDHAGCDIAVLPTGADPRPHTQSYVQQLSSYRTVLLAQDNDRAGDVGAAILADQLPQAVRYAVPEGNDWCSYNGPLPEIPQVAAEQVLVSLGDMLELEPPPTVSWFERAVLPVAGSLILHGWAKSFKSFLALDLMAALAQGQPWALFEPTEEPCKVAVMQYEIPWGYFQHRLQQLAHAATEPALLRENFFGWTPMNRPHFAAGNVAQEDEILRVLTEQGIQVFLLDPIRRATGMADLNSEKEVRPLLHFYERLNDEGITVVTCHHDNKTYAKQGGGDALGMTGAGAFAGDFDTIVSVSLPKGISIENPQRNLSFTLRNAPSIGARSMAMNEAGSIEYSLTPVGPTDPDDNGEPSI